MGQERFVVFIDSDNGIFVQAIAHGVNAAPRESSLEEVRRTGRLVTRPLFEEKVEFHQIQTDATPRTSRRDNQGPPSLLRRVESGGEQPSLWPDAERIMAEIKSVLGEDFAQYGVALVLDVSRFSNHELSRVKEVVDGRPVYEITEKGTRILALIDYLATQGVSVSLYVSDTDTLLTDEFRDKGVPIISGQNTLIRSLTSAAEKKLKGEPTV